MLLTKENPDLYGTHHSWEEWTTLELRTGLQKSMPDLLDEIREIRFESNKGTKCRVMEATGLGTTVHVKWKLANNEFRFGGGLIEITRRKLRGMFGQLRHENRKIVLRIYDGHKDL